MQCDLLVSNFKSPKTIALVKDNIGHIPDGSLSYRADPFTLGLKKAFDLKKQKNGVKSRCSYYHCSWYHNQVSRSSARSDGRCPSCGNWMQCIGCGTNWNDNRPSCRGCGKRFI